MLTVYSKANCQQCDKLKLRLKTQGIEYTEIRVDLQPEARQFLLDQGHRSVPVVYEDGVHLKGY